MNAQWKRRFPPLALLLVLLALVVRLNQVEKVPLVVREGQSFERGTVTQILQDNLQLDGSRSGQQLVAVRMNTGELKGQEVQMTSSSGATSIIT